MAQIRKLQLGGTTLRFGSDRIVDANTFNEKAAAEVEDYIASQNWSKKELERFRTAYLDLMSRGVTGMLVINGVRNTTYEGEQIDNLALAKKLRNAYGDAAYYINRKLEENSYSEEEKRKKDEEKAEKEEKKRLEGLPKYTPSDFDKFFIKKVFGGQENPNISDWDDMDKVDPSTHYRGIENRKQALGKLIEEYIRELPELNYEGSAFKDAEEHKLKLENALHALQLGNLDEIKQALNAAGINWKHFLETDTLTAEGRLNFEQLQQQQSQVQLLAEQPAELQEQSNTDVEVTLTGLEETNPELEIKKGQNKYDGMGIVEVFKKDPVYFTEILSSLALDVASIIDVEPVSAGALGVGAAAARHAAAVRAGEDRPWYATALDYGIGVLGAVPLLGDWALAARATKTLATFMKRAGQALGALFIAKGGKQVLDKINSGESLSFNDWKMVADVLIGVKAITGAKTGKAVEALNEARGLKMTGEVTFKINKGGTPKEITVKVKDSPDAEIWKSFKRKSVEELKRILSENPDIQKALTKEGVEPKDITITEGGFLSKARNNSTTGYITGKTDVQVVKKEGVYTRKPLSEQDVDAVADANRGWVIRGLWRAPKNYNRRVYRNVYREMESGNVVGPEWWRSTASKGVHRGYIFGRDRTRTGSRRFELDEALKLPRWAVPGLNKPGLYMKFGTKTGGEYPYMIKNNGDGTFTISNSLSNSGRNEYIVDTQKELDDIFGVFGKKNNYKTKVDRQAAYQTMLEKYGIFRLGGKIYKNLDSYLTDFLINNK